MQIARGHKILETLVMHVILRSMEWEVMKWCLGGGEMVSDTLITSHMHVILRSLEWEGVPGG